MILTCKQAQDKLSKIRDLKKRFDLELEIATGTHVATDLTKIKKMLIKLVGEVREGCDVYNFDLRRKLIKKIGASFIGDFKDGQAIAEFGDDKQCVVDKEENKVGDYYQTIERSNGKYIVELNQTTSPQYIMDNKGKIISEQLQSMNSFSNGLFMAKDSTFHTCLLNNSGKIIVRDDIMSNIMWQTKDEYPTLAIKRGNRWTIYDASGNILGRENYLYIDSMSEGKRAVKSEKSSEYCYLTVDGKESQEKFYTAGKFSEGRAIVIDGINKGYCYIDENYKPIKNADHYTFVRSFKNGRAFAKKIKDENCIVIDKDGNQVGKNTYEEVYDFRDGVASVKINGGWHVINRNGDIIAGPYFNFKITKGKMTIAAKDSTKSEWFLINEQGQELPYKYEEIKELENGFFDARMGIRKHDLLDRDGKQIVKNMALPFTISEGIIKAWLLEKNFFYDESGQKIGNDYINTGHFHNGRALVKKRDKKWYLLDKRGNEYGEGYDTISYDKVGFFKVEQDGEKYLIDMFGRTFP